MHENPCKEGISSLSIPGKRKKSTEVPLKGGMGVDCRTKGLSCNGGEKDQELKKKLTFSW